MSKEFNLSKSGILFTSIVLAFALQGCANPPGWLSSSGPSREQVLETHDTNDIQGIALINVTNALAEKLAAGKAPPKFSGIFSSTSSNNYLIGPGDVIEVSIWEAPPAMLFGAVVPDLTRSTGVATNVTTLPSQMVPPDGTIAIPFGGRVSVEGRSTQQIEAAIVNRLQGKANHPQVLVRVAKNNTSNVTVVGEVNNSAMMPLTPRGERLLDALAFSGGVKQPVNRTAVQLSRGNTTTMMPLDSIIRDPRQNIMLKPGDVVTALFQSQTFSVLGATGKNDEIAFEAEGISLAQALARSGGLNDNRADARGVFIFRFEDARLVDLNGQQVTKSSTGQVPVVYEINLRDPAALFVAQNFPVQNHDVIYVTNSPSADFEKFLRLLVSVAVPAASMNYYFKN
ncbi:polysaccharide export protein [Paraburkholderia dipogonis]|uniref:Polysaccharide export protein n=1 Tax=Paraburkholderia dipogonis TaxID=1211383 RepID=A0ABW9B409_9BURK